MDIETMHIAVKLELDKSSALELPAFEPEEIDLWLNNAIRKFVKTRYSGMNSKGQSFEQSQKRTDDLRTLYKQVTILPESYDSSHMANSYIFKLPVEDSGEGGEDYWLTIMEQVSHSAISGLSGITECTLDEYPQKVADPFSEHHLHYGDAKPLRIYGVTNGSDEVWLASDGNYTINEYHLAYLRKPATVDNIPAGTTDCDLPEHTHDEIVKLAVSMMLENIEQPRYQTYQNELNTIE